MMFKLIVVGVVSAVATMVSAEQKPNVIMLYYDDMGYGDLGVCFKSISHWLLFG